MSSNALGGRPSIASRAGWPTDVATELVDERRIGVDDHVPGP